MTPCRHMVSELFHSPRRGVFHRSLTVLFAIGLWKYLALPVSSGRFARAIRVSSYSRTKKKLFRFRRQGFHLLGRRFPAASAIETVCNFFPFTFVRDIFALQPPRCTRSWAPSFDSIQNLVSRVWASSLSLAATDEIRIGFFSSWY